MNIPTSKIQRTSKFVRTGFKVGGNYLKHYSKKLINAEASKEELDEQNAKDIYNTLSELKGSALKAAQMLSMDRGILPAAFANQFAQAQHKAPPLSGPLIVKTFRQYFGKSPAEIFDEFDMEAAHAASIGQVHRARKGAQTYAIKIQYPGVGDSVLSDLNLIKPVAKRMFGWKEKDIQIYFDEVKDRLVEETDYQLELQRSMNISSRCSALANVQFATYFPDLSADRVITMSWEDGLHLDEFLRTNPSPAIRDQVGQALWDFYNYQLHELKIMHADAHPGNYLFRLDGEVVILDFGCVKEIPADFYKNYFALLQPEVMQDDEQFEASLKAAQLIFDTDSPAQKELYIGVAKEAMGIVLQPFHQAHFDFGDEGYFDQIYAFGERMARDKAWQQTDVPRGDKDGIYLNRTYFGLFSILNKLKAKIETRRFIPTAV